MTTAASPHRAAYMQAMVDLAFERGYEDVAVEEIAARAGGSAEDFESAFGSKESCALALIEERWPDSLRAAAYAHARWLAEDSDSVPASTAESIVGAIAELMARNGERTEQRDPVAAVPEMMYLAVRPYLGERAARRELTIPPPTD